MTTRITEGRQHLEFDSSWQVVAWDATDEYDFLKSTFANLSATPPRSVKGSDVVGVRPAVGSRRAVVAVAEFKDFDHPNIPPGQRLAAARHATSDKLMSDVIAKVIDTLVGASFGHDATRSRLAALDEWRRSLGDPHTQILVLVCVELPASQVLAAQAWATALKRRLRWLGGRASVSVTSSRSPFRGSGIRYRL